MLRPGPILLEADDSRCFQALLELRQVAHELRALNPPPRADGPVGTPDGGDDALVNPGLNGPSRCPETPGGFAYSDGVRIDPGVGPDVFEVKYPLAVGLFPRPGGGIATVFPGLLVGAGDIGGGIEGAIDGLDVASSYPCRLQGRRIVGSLFRGSSFGGPELRPGNTTEVSSSNPATQDARDAGSGA